MKHRHKMAADGKAKKKMDYMQESHEVEHEAGLRKHGGKVAHHKRGGKAAHHESGGAIHGSKAHHRMDKRARGGAVHHKKHGGANATMNPYSSAKC